MCCRLAHSINVGDYTTACMHDPEQRWRRYDTLKHVTVLLFNPVFVTCWLNRQKLYFTFECQYKHTTAITGYVSVTVKTRQQQAVEDRATVGHWAVRRCRVRIQQHRGIHENRQQRHKRRIKGNWGASDEKLGRRQRRRRAIKFHNCQRKRDKEKQGNLWQPSEVGFSIFIAALFDHDTACIVLRCCDTFRSKKRQKMWDLRHEVYAIMWMN